MLPVPGISVSVPQGAQGPQGDQGPGGPVGGLTYATVAALEAATVPATNTLAYVRGYAPNNDGGQGYYRYDSGSSATVDHGLVATAAGGTGRWVRQYSETVNVRWFGATGDGTTNDAAAIQAAINAVATAGGGVVLFPPGTYAITTPLSITTSGISLIGVSPQSSIIKVASGNTTGVTILGASAGSTIAQITLKNLQFLGPGKASAATGYGVSIKWTSVDVLLDNCWIKQWGSHGIYMNDAYSATFERVLTESNGGCGYYGETNINNILWNRCVVLLNADAGIKVIGGAAALMLACDIESNAKAGVDLRYAFAYTIQSCDFEGNGTDTTSPNIYLHFKTNVADKANMTRIIGNNIEGKSVTAIGVLVDGANQTAIDGNRFDGQVTDNIKTTSNASRTLIGAMNNYATGSASPNDSSASTATLRYDTTNLIMSASPGILLVPRSSAPPATAEGELWWNSTTHQLNARDNSATRVVASGFEGSATYDPPSLAAGASATTAVTVTGAAVGDVVLASHDSITTGGWLISGSVSAANTVRVTLLNQTGGTVDLASGTLRAVVLRY